MKLKLGFSPCPNDTFMFYALLHNKVDTQGLEFEPVIADVEELNNLAFRQKLDISKLSCHAYSYVCNNYLLLNSGSAVGYKNGPLLIGKQKIDFKNIENLTIAIPGKLTTANLLLSIAFPGIWKKDEYLFSSIEEAVLSGKADAGLIIHETRFTFKNKGLIQLIDFGEYWESLTGLPLPLGAIAIGRAIPRETQLQFDRILKKSIEYAVGNPKKCMPYIKQHAQETEESILLKHINLYVNEFSLDLGVKGKEAVMALYRIAHEKGLIQENPQDIFIPLAV
ncbi:MAG: 1,4-dihydroxy-6-naphthoate synthase [Bacteroidia bacterium]|nr:1,4-dihydroxy-6-naphthoate synthase [Bacteroidia bacterium]